MIFPSVSSNSSSASGLNWDPSAYDCNFWCKAKASLILVTSLKCTVFGIFKHFILIAVAQLTMKIGVPVGGGRAGFFFHRSLFEIAVRVLLFWHRALRDEGFACGVVRQKLGGRIISGPQPISVIGPRSRPLFLCSYGALPRPSRVPSRIAYIRRRAGRRRRRYGN